MKVFADVKLKAAQMPEFVPDRLENSAGKGKNAAYEPFRLFPHCYQHFLVFPQSFLKAPFLGLFKTLDCLGQGYGCL